MKIDNPYPFNEYDCYLNTHTGMNRKQVCIKHTDTGNRKTILYSKFLMSIKEGRILESHEEVDHLDGDKTNDRIENLEIVTRKENKRRYANTQTRQMITLTCIQCNATFERERRQVIYKESYLSGHICCSRKCANSLRRSLL